MPSYQTAKFDQYDSRFVEVALSLFERVRPGIPEPQTKRHEGSFTVFGTTAGETAAKIVIYEPDLRRQSMDWPFMRDGVYVWIRANGSVGDGIWDDILPVELPWMFRRMQRHDTVQIAANPEAEFAYFPVMAGDDFGHIAILLSGCSRY
jgi:hypothetical protein